MIGPNCTQVPYFSTFPPFFKKNLIFLYASKSHIWVLSSCTLNNHINRVPIPEAKSYFCNHPNWV